MTAVRHAIPLAGRTPGERVEEIDEVRGRTANYDERAAKGRGPGNRDRQRRAVPSPFVDGDVRERTTDDAVAGGEHHVAVEAVHVVGRALEAQCRIGRLENRIVIDTDADDPGQLEPAGKCQMCTPAQIDAGGARRIDCAVCRGGCVANQCYRATADPRTR